MGMPDELGFRDREVELKDFENLKESYPAELYPHLLKAKELYLNLISVYDKKMLIHGGAHSYNIISCGEDTYKVVKPAAVIGDPIFDAGAFIFGECCYYGKKLAEPETAEKIIDYLEKSLNIPNKILRQSFYITTIRCYQGIDRANLAESVLNKGK